MNDQLIQTSIQCHSDLGESYIHLKTGNIYSVSKEAIHIADEGTSDFPTLLEEEITIAKHFLDNQQEYISLLSKDEANEYQMM